MHVLRKIAAAALLVLAAVPLVAAEPAIILPAEGTFRSGSIIEVRWENLPAGVEELEFLLVRGDRREEIVRLTPQLVPDRGSFEWLVPDLSTNAASLRLRVGIHDEEIDLAESTTFAIAEARDEESLVFRDGEWWISPLGRSTAARTFSDSLAPSPLRRSVATVRSRRRFNGTLPRVVIMTASAVRPIAPASADLAVLSAAPLVTPQRK